MNYRWECKTNQGYPVWLLADEYGRVLEVLNEDSSRQLWIVESEKVCYLTLPEAQRYVEARQARAAAEAEQPTPEFTGGVRSA